MNADVLIIGAGPAGLAAAVELRRLGAAASWSSDRDEAAAAFPGTARTPGSAPGPAPGADRPGLCAPVRRRGGGRRGGHPAGHPGPAGTARPTPARPRSGGAPPGDSGPHRLTLTSAAGVQTVHARAVLLATGCRRGPDARLVPGDRPPGIMTTGELQRRVYLAASGCPVGRWSSARSASASPPWSSGARRGAGGRAGHRPAQAQLCRVRASGTVALACPGVAWHRGSAGHRPGRLEGVELADARTGGPGLCRATGGVHRRLDTDHELARLAWPWTGYPRPGRGHGTGDLGARRVRGRQPGARRGNGGHRRARRPARGRRDRGVPAGRGGAGDGAAARDGERGGRGLAPEPRPAAGGTVAPPLLWIAPNVLRAGARPRHGDVSCCAATPSPGWPGSKSGRTGGGWPRPLRIASNRTGRCGSAPPGRAGPTPAAAR